MFRKHFIVLLVNVITVRNPGFYAEIRQRQCLDRKILNAGSAIAADEGMNPMLFRLFLLFSIVPIIEIWLLIKVGKVIGAVPTICLLLVISMVGAWLAKSQGLRAIEEIRYELAAGRLPAARLLDGAMILAGGILLLTPGFFTDFIGLFFLFPVSRILLKGWLRNFLERELSRGTIIIHRR